MVHMAHGLKARLPKIWLSKGWASDLLLPLAWAYGALVWVRQFLYRVGLFKSEKVNATVIVVGNAVAGGGGKTPLTMAVVAHLQQAGYAVGVISRGYGRSTQDVREVTPQSRPEDVGDEPLMMCRRLQVPVFVALKRSEAAHALLKAYPATHILVCDDGLQHYALARDIEICALDARGIGNGRLLPAGPLREPWPRKVDLLIHTAERSHPEGFASSRTLSDCAVDAHGTSLALRDLPDLKVNAVAAIAQPEAFFNMLKTKGLALQQTWARPDHDSFTDWTPPPTDTPLLCTEKDATKLWPRYPLALAVPLVFEPEALFWTALDERVNTVRH
jgi:tetraacyldisaccharide 4'-kinase